MTQTLFGTRRLAPALLCLSLVVAASGCDLTVSDPNATTEEDAFGTRAGLLASARGLQTQYVTSTFDNLVTTTGITSREFAADNTFANLLDLELGGAGLATDNGNVGGIFREGYQTISTASDLIAGAQSTEGLSSELRAGLTAFGEFYKAAAIGALAIAFTDVAVETSRDGPVTYLSRQAALVEAASLLASAEQRLTTTPPGSALSGVVPAGFDLLNTVRAYRARFELFAGNNDAAFAAAGRVDLSSTSVFTFSSGAQNPLYLRISPIVGQPSFAVRDNLGLEDVEDGDGRIAYFTEPNPDTSVNGFPIETATGFIAEGPLVSIPAYVPDEMLLIRAEVLARRGDTNGAVDAIDAVRTDESDPFGLAAGLDEYDGSPDLQSLLDEIYYNRSTELYLQGLRLEDARRLNQGAPAANNPFQRTRNFYAFPQQERLANPETTPGDPAI